MNCRSINCFSINCRFDELSFDILSCHVRYQCSHVLCLIGNPGNDDSLLLMSSVHDNPACDGFARDSEEKKANAKREFDRQNLA